MGTDIHRFAERRTATGWEPCCGDQVDDNGKPCLLDFYCGEERNYALFAILAGVRRMTNGGLEPIVPPRGYPADASLPGPTEDGCCYHNATWLSVRELLDFPWQEKKLPFRVWVDAAQYAVFKRTGRPERTTEESGRVLTHAQMDRLLAEGGDTAGALTLVDFGVPYAEFAGPFVTETVPLLLRQGPPEDVRLVLYFDS
jgi:hypothetical protein